MSIHYSVHYQRRNPHIKSVGVSFFFLILFSIWLHSAYSQRIDREAGLALIAENVRFSMEQTKRLLQDFEATKKAYPRSLNKEGKTTATNMYDWTSGFFPGNLWYLYELSGEPFFKENAKRWTDTLEPLKTYTAHHDLGFMMYCSFGNGYRLIPEETAGYKEILLEGARSLCTRFSETTQCIQSWPSKKSWHNTLWKFPVIMDNMMNLELLMWASKTTTNAAESARFRYIATTHANTTMKNHLRADYSSFHVVDYNPETGEVIEQATNQGWSDNSTWSRGQGWGIYGFTMMYRETGDEKYLDTARKMADFYLQHPALPEDKIPYWDFNAGQPGYCAEWPDRTKAFPVDPYRFPVAQYRDASAGALVASALFELHAITREADYLNQAIQMIHSLSSPAYRAEAGSNGNFVLMHSVGSIPHGSEIDVPLVYADYYFYEALLRYKSYLKSQS